MMHASTIASCLFLNLCVLESVFLHSKSKVHDLFSYILEVLDLCIQLEVSESENSLPFSCIWESEDPLLSHCSQECLASDCRAR